MLTIRNIAFRNSVNFYKFNVKSLLLLRGCDMVGLYVIVTIRLIHEEDSEPTFCEEPDALELTLSWGSPSKPSERCVRSVWKKTVKGGL